MDQNDQDDIIKKVKTAGNNDNQDDNSDDSNDNNDGGSDGDTSGDDFGGDLGGDQGGSDESMGDLNEEKEASIFLANPKKNDMFQPGSNDKLNESCWKGYKQVGMKEKDGKSVPNCVPINEDLKVTEKSSIFDKIKSKLQETFNQEDETMTEPTIEPAVKPAPVKTPKTAPIAPSRKNKPFLPMPEVQPDPKASK